MTAPDSHAVSIEQNGLFLQADLGRPPGTPTGLVLFAHGSGSGRHSPRNRAVASALEDQGLATLLLDLLTPEEDRVDQRTREYRFDIPLLAERLVIAMDWLQHQPQLAALPLAVFGASTGAAAALIAAARRPEQVRAVVSRGGRPDLAGDHLPRVQAPTLLIVGGKDPQVLQLNRDASQHMHCPVEIREVPGATHLFEEPGALEQVAQLAAHWFLTHLPAGDG